MRHRPPPSTQISPGGGPPRNRVEPPARSSEEIFARIQRAIDKAGEHLNQLPESGKYRT